MREPIYNICGKEIGMFAYKVLDLAQKLHGESCGSGLGNCSFGECEIYVNFLIHRLMDWVTPCEHTKRYDKNVQFIVACAVSDYLFFIDAFTDRKVNLTGCDLSVLTLFSDDYKVKK